MKQTNRQKFSMGEEMDLKKIKEVEMPSVNSEDSIENMFRNEQNANQNDVKEIFGEDRIKVRTDLSSRQIKLITKAFYLAELTGVKEIHVILLDFMKLRISDSRKSRIEFVEGLKARIENAMQQSAMQLRGQFGK